VLSADADAATDIGGARRQRAINPVNPKIATNFFIFRPKPGWGIL